LANPSINDKPAGGVGLEWRDHLPRAAKKRAAMSAFIQLTSFRWGPRRMSGLGSVSVPDA